MGQMFYQQDPGLKRKRKLAEAMLKQGQSNAPIKHWLQGAGRMANAYVGQSKLDDLDAKEQKSKEDYYKSLAGAMSGPDAESITTELLNNPATAEMGAQMRLQQVMQKPAGRQTAKDVSGYLRDVNTGERIFADAEKTPSGPGDYPKDVQSALWYGKASPEERSHYDKTKRQPQFLNLGGKFMAPGTGAEYEVGLKPGERPEVRAAQQAAVLTAKAAAKKETGKVKAGSSLSSTEAKTKMLTGLIDEAKKDAGTFTTGFTGSALASIAGTPAHDLSNKLNTIKANIGFDRLQEMRDNSVTGGALGQVSEMENRLLQSVWGSLEQSQSKEQFVDNLDLVDKAVKASWERVEKAYEADYGTPYSPDAKLSSAAELPEGVSMEDVEHTAKQHGMTTEQVIERLRAQ